ncbi:translation initiation factor IF-2 subunit alpha [Candidatus Bathyarchaeota archaeon]|nr:translation initiation factor IF-2 subunit alpha [Candidatus Bathyarchaeota archaeon]
MADEEFPEVGDLVIATVDRITEYGAYVILDEYDKEGFLHISEISSSWIRNIKDYVREGQKLVLKVLRVNRERGQIDLSLRRVSKREKREKLLAWNLDKKAESILRSISERAKISLDKIREVVEKPILEKYGNLYVGFEEVARGGRTVLQKLEIPEELEDLILEIVKEKVKLPSVKITGILELQSLKPDGVLGIRKALLAARDIKRKNAKVNIYVVSPPRYRVEVNARDYRTAEKVLKESVEIALETIKKEGGTGTFKREK